MILLLISILIVSIIYLVAYKPFQYWKNKNVPYVKPVPIFGNRAKIILKQITMDDWILEMYNSRKTRYTGCYSFTSPSLMINDLNLIKQLAIKYFDHFTDHRAFITEDIDPLFGKNLFAMKGDNWRNMRATLSPAFTSSKMRSIYLLIEECAKEHTRYFEEILKTTKKPIELEMKDTFTRFANDIIATSAFGIECNSIRNKDNQFYLMGKDATNFGGSRSFMFIGLNLCKPLMKLFNVKLFSDKLCDFFRNIITSTINTREKNDINRPDMIQLLMEARKGKLKHESVRDEDVGFATVEESEVGKNDLKNKIDLTDEVITAQALLFFIAGFDTISTAMCHMAYELAINQDIQRKLQEEIDETFNENGQKFTYEVIFKMKYLDMVLSETLRKWPPVSKLDRVCVKPFTIEPETPNEKPVTLNKEDVIWFPVYGIHRDPKYYPNPEKFDPERFSDENKTNIKPMSYLPFGVGPRNCIGSRFALMEAKTIFAHLLLKFDLILIEKSQVPIQFKKGEFLMYAERGFWLGMKNRF